jgi:hypothetical protein
MCRQVLVRVAGLTGHLGAHPLRRLEGLAQLFGVELDLGGDQALQAPPVDVDIEVARLSPNVVARLANPPPFREWPQLGETLGSYFDLDLGPPQSVTALDRQQGSVAEPAQAHLDLIVFDSQISLLDFLDATVRQLIRNP